MTESKLNSSAPGQSPAEMPRVQFLNEGVKNSYANICNVASTREDIVLNFGLNQAWERPQQEVQVQLTNRIILNPHTAKRLALLLGAVVQQYEKQFGALDIGAAQVQASPADQTRSAGADTKPHVVK